MQQASKHTAYNTTTASNNDVRAWVPSVPVTCAMYRETKQNSWPETSVAIQYNPPSS